MNNKIRKISLNLDDLSDQEIKATSELLSRSLTEIIRGAVRFYCPLLREQKSGNRIMITITDASGQKVREYLAVLL